MSDLLVTSESNGFNTSVVKQGALIRATHCTWQAARNGIVAYAKKDFCRVLFLHSVNTAASYFTIKASEVADGQWTIMLTNDMEDVYLLRHASAADLVAEVRKLFKEEEP